MKTTSHGTSPAMTWASGPLAEAPRSGGLRSSTPRDTSVLSIDSYAQSILERNATSGSQPDQSLGPYITSVLRVSEAMVDVTKLADYDGLLELVQEHCGVAATTAQTVVQQIATTVWTGEVPVRDSDQQQQQQALNGFPTLSVLHAVLPEEPKRPQLAVMEAVVNEEDFPSLAQATEADGQSSNAGILSPHKADSLLPLHLLDDNPAVGGGILDTSPEQASVTTTEFPPLSASSTTVSGKKRGKRSTLPTGATTKQSADDVAAALFRPSRSRSIDETTSTTTSPKQLTANNNTAAACPPDPYIDPEQYQIVTGMLLNMIMDLSPEAAYEAAVLAHGDVSLAHYLVQSALTAPPVCRHLLQSGCYRSDCQFSHDLEGHSCLFWIRGRCGKGDSCRFLHGFNKAKVDELQNMLYPPESSAASVDDYYTSERTVTNGPGYNNNNMIPASTAWSSEEGNQTVAAAFPSTGTAGTLDSLSPVRTSAATTSFANIASQGYKGSFLSSSWKNHTEQTTAVVRRIQDLPTTRIPQDLWKPHENRDASVFYIPDPLERYRQVMATTQNECLIHGGFMDLHYQSTKTFGTVLSTLLPVELQRHEQVWIVTGTGHHVGSRTHQRGGGALEAAVLQWLMEEGYDNVYRGRDANGLGGAVLVKR